MRRPLSLLLGAAIVATWPARAALAQDFNAIWVAGPTDVWAAGSSGLVMRGLNGAWTTLPATSSEDLRDIWGSGPRDLWIVGEGSTILRWNGSALGRLASPISTDFIAVHGCAANDVWLVGQSEDQSQPPPLLHWNGTALTVERLPVAFRAADIVGVCLTGAGGGGGGLTIVGTSFFDPRPTERRYVGVVVRRQGAAWTSLCWDGRRVTDEQLCGTPWTGVAAGGGVTLLRGGEQGEVLLLSSRAGWTRLPSPPGEYETAIVTADGSPVLIMEDGWARLTAGQWRRIGRGPAIGAGVDQGEMSRITTRLTALAQKMQTGQMTAAEQQEWQQLQARVMQVSSGVQAQVQAASAEAQRAASRNFGRSPAVFPAATGSDFYVASDGGTIFHVSGDNSRIVHSVLCATNPALCR